MNGPELSPELSRLFAECRPMSDPAPERLDNVRRRLGLPVALASAATLASPHHRWARLVRLKPLLGVLALAGLGALGTRALPQSDGARSRAGGTAAERSSAVDVAAGDESPPGALAEATRTEVAVDDTAVDDTATTLVAPPAHTPTVRKPKMTAAVPERRPHSTTTATTLDLEITALSEARSLLSRGNPTAALKALARRKFVELPGSALALQAIALCEAGRRSEGLAAAKRAAPYADANRLANGVASACETDAPAH